MKKSKSYNSKVNTSAGCDLVKKFLCCYTSLQNPLKHPLEEKVTKSATLAENEEGEDEDGPAPDVPPSLLIEEKKNEETRFLLVSSRTRAMA